MFLYIQIDPNPSILALVLVDNALLLSDYELSVMCIKSKPFSVHLVAK